MTGEAGVKPFLTLQGICATEEGLRLENLDFQAGRGEIVSVVSLHPGYLRLFREVLCGEIEPSGGLITAEGKEIKKAANLRKLTGLVKDRGEVFPDLTVAENICLNRVGLLRFSPQREIEYARELIDRYQLSIDISRNIDSLSAMEKLLVQILRSVSSGKPLAVFFDSMSSLGPHEKKSFLDILRDLKEKGKAVVYLTGTLSDALLLADTVAILNNGSITSVRSAREAKETPREVLHELSGWSVLGEDENLSVDTLRAIVTSREIMTSSKELGHSLEYLAEDMKKVFRAERIVLCLTNQAQREVFDFVEYPRREKSYTPWNDADVCAMIAGEETVVARASDPQYANLFARHGDMKMLVCTPVHRPGKTSSLIMVFHESVREMDEMYHFYLSAFAKEIAIALETSELLGRSTLLQESHHRIKNNLQMINSLVYLEKQAVRRKQLEPGEAFDAIVRQVSSIATVHNILSNDSEKESIINLATIIRELIKTYSYSGIDIRLELENVSIPYNKATMLAIVVNELLTNSIKYAFEGREGADNRISISLSNDGIHIRLVIEDNGIGYRKGDRAKGSGLGTGLTGSIITSVKGTMEVESGDGTRTIITVPVSRIYDAGNSAV